MFGFYAVIAEFEGSLIPMCLTVDCAELLCLCRLFSQINWAVWIN